jgi:hypothetical protein
MTAEDFRRWVDENAKQVMSEPDVVDQRLLKIQQLIENILKGSK